MAITAARHVESVMRGGAASVVVTCQRIGESHGIHRRRWSRFVAVTVACQGIVELCGVRHRKWSRVAMVTAACQGAWICRLKLGSGRSPISIEVRERSSWRLGSWVEPYSRGSPGGTLSEPKLRAEPGSRRSPGGVCLRL